jgi:hypothetical protein
MTDAGFRFGAVFALTATLLLFAILAPSAAWSRAVGVLLSGATLFTVAATSGAPRHNKRVAGITILVVLIVATALSGSGVLSKTSTFIAAGVLTVLALPALVAGLFRLLRARGVTIQAVTGALAVYLMIGVVFSFAVGAVAEASSQPYFAQPGVGKGSQSQRAYFSITVLTTTGLGDLTPATKGGRALTVLEELLGQLYLVTVVSLLVANVGRGRVSRDTPPPSR